jgi:two-component system NarL family response regulator
LLVEDHRLVRQALLVLLESDPSFHVVGEAGSGREAVALARELLPDVVVMDVAMKGQNGIAATREIRQFSAKIAIVALSSHDDPRYVKAMLEAGAAAYVLKADAYHDLVRAISVSAEGGSYLSRDAASAAGVVDAPASSYTMLGRRERQVLQLLAEGHSSPEISTRLQIAPSTAETHRRNIVRKLGIHSVAELTKYAVREGLTKLDPSPGP